MTIAAFKRPSFISVAVIKILLTKTAIGGGGGALQPTVPGYSPSLWESQGSNSEQLVIAHLQSRAEKNE